MIITFPIPPCGDYVPLLAIEDGRLGAWVSECEHEDIQVETLDNMMMMLYPNRSWKG